MNPEPGTERTYTTFQIAKICNVFPTTVINWVNRKKIKAYTTPGGHRRVLHTDLLEFFRQYRFPVSEGMLGPSKRILIVEDDPAVGRLLSQALKRASSSVRVDWLQNGVEALLILGRQPPDLVVLDVVMPVVDGARVLATLRSDPKTKHVKVIGITGKRLPPEKLRYMRLHSDAFLVKPFDIRELTKTALGLLGVAAR